MALARGRLRARVLLSNENRVPGGLAGVVACSERDATIKATAYAGWRFAVGGWRLAVGGWMFACLPTAPDG